MSDSHVFDLATIVVGVAYVAVMVLALGIAGPPQKTTLRRLVVATRLSRLAVGLAVLALAANVLDIPADGWIGPALWIVTSTMAAASAIFMRRRRDMRGDQVVAEAERTVRDFAARLGRES